VTEDSEDVDSVIGAGSELRKFRLADSIVGAHSRIETFSGSVLVTDHSVVRGTTD
jgi:hypothetical protein